jgi:hypothetical protein
MEAVGQVFTKCLRSAPQSLGWRLGRAPARLRLTRESKRALTARDVGGFVGRRARLTWRVRGLRLRQSGRARTAVLFEVRSNHAQERTRGWSLR